MEKHPKFKLWKELTKEVVRKKLTQQKILALEREDRMPKEEPMSWTHRTELPKLMIATRGFNYSGSGALLALFHEFDNMEICGFTEPQFSNKPTMKQGSECGFFMGSFFCELVNAFREGSPVACDCLIRHFIGNAQSAYFHKRSVEWEGLSPHVYDDTFRDLVREFLDTVLDLDDATRQFMQGRLYPVRVHDNSSLNYEGCSFQKISKSGAGYLFYRFRDMPWEEFKQAAARFLRGFFSQMGTSDIMVYDQLLHRNELKTINELLDDNPIRQVCVYRDPRDMYVFFSRAYANLYIRNIDLYEEKYRHNSTQGYRYGLEDLLANPDPNMLMVRFEDLVLKYDETVAGILDFLGIDASHHVDPRSVFNPAISVRNIGVYKDFEDQDFIRSIEERLSEYCYEPEKENLSSEAWELLESTGNWKKS